MEYMKTLPIELKIEILSYLGTTDILQLCEVFPHWDTCAVDRDILKSICFFRGYRLRDKFDNFVRKKINPNFVTSLNINCCYWIPRGVLCKCIQLLTKLKCLYVIDTNFQFCIADLQMLKPLKELQRLAIGMGDHKRNPLILNHIPSKLTGLCLHSSVPLEYDFFEKLIYLEEIWLVCPNSKKLCGTKYLFPESVQRIVLSLCWQCDPPTSFGRAVTFLSYHNTSTICVEKLNNFIENAFWQRYPLHFPIETIHKDFWEFYCRNTPVWKAVVKITGLCAHFGISDSRKLLLRECTLELINFEELNFGEKNRCLSSLQLPVANIIVSHNTQLLKKLSISCCLLGAQNKAPVETVDAPLFKRTRVSINNSVPGGSLLDKAVDNSPLLEELEIWECRIESKKGRLRNSMLDGISKFIHLRKLTITEIPSHVSCDFLVDVCKECKHLCSLRISSLVQHNKLNNYLCLALPYAASLIDLRVEQPYLAVDRFFESLSNIKDSKLQRIAIITKHIEKFSVEFFDTFLTTTANLCFLYLFIKDLPMNAVNHTKCTISKYKKHPQQIFIVTNASNATKARRKIPNIHLFEMVHLNTSVSVLDVFNGFK